MTSAASPVAADIRIVRSALPEKDGEQWTAEASVLIGGDEPVFAGHTSFLIFPGFCVVECVHRAALTVKPAGVAGLTLATVESARFVGVVCPHDVLTIELRWARKHLEWICSARARTGRGDAATVRLRYQTGATA